MFKIHVITGRGVIFYVIIAYSKMIKIYIVLIFTSDALFISAGFGKLLWPVTFVLSDRISKRIWVGLHFPTLCHTLLHYSTLSYTTTHFPTLRHTLLHYATLSYTIPHSPTLAYAALSYTLRRTLLLYAALSYSTPHSPTLLQTLVHYATLSYIVPHCALLRYILLHYDNEHLKSI